LRTPNLRQQQVLWIQKKFQEQVLANRSNAITGSKHYTGATLADRSETLQAQARLNLNFEEYLFSYTCNFGVF